MTGKRIKKLITTLVTLLMFVALSLDVLWIFEYRVQDAIFQNPRVPHPDVFVIGIDDHTLAELGQFHTWSRELMAEALTILNSHESLRPAVIAVDVLYVDTGHPAIDQLLFDAVAETDNILLASSIEVGIDNQFLHLEEVITQHILPLDPLLPYVYYGFVNGTFDRDGVARSASLRVPFEGDFLYSFPVMAAAIYLDAPPSTLLPPNLSETVIAYAGYPGDFFGFSFSDIFEPWFDPTWLTDAIVLIGPYAMGMMDHHLVSIDPTNAMYGVEIHANIIQQILEQQFITRPTPFVNVSIAMGTLVLIMALGEFSRLRWALISVVVVSVVYYFIALYAFGQGFMLPLLYPLIGMFFAGIYQLVYEYILQEVEKTKLRNTFKKYVDPKLVDVLIKNKSADSDAVGQKLDIAVMFIDVRGFTPLSEALQDRPELVVEILNNYLEITSASIFNNGGSVDKFIGDATMALFNGFVPLEDYIYKAVKAAWDIVEKADAFNADIQERYGVNVGFGIGIHCGEAIVGNLGPSFRKDYTAIGDTVNTAARLESNASPSQVLISEATYALLKDRITASPVGEVALKGKSQPMMLYELRGLR